jgi:hypothetical protein
MIMFSKRLTSFLAVVVFVPFVAACGDDDEPSIQPTPLMSKIRVIHASFDGPPVDVSIDGKVAITSLAFGKSSGFASVEAGTRAFKVMVSGGGPTLIDKSFQLSPNSDYTVFAVNQASSIEELVSAESRSPTQDKVRVRFLHASPDAPAVDIRLGSGDGTAVFSNVSFKDLTDYIEVDPATLDLVVTPAGKSDVVVALEPVTLEKGQVFTILALGTLAGEDMYPFSVKAYVDNESGSDAVDIMAKAPEKKKSMVLVVHASPDAPGVDLLVDDMMVNDKPLTFPMNTGYLSVESGMRNIKVNVAGTSTTAIGADIDFEADKSYSLFAVNRVASIEPLLIEDDLTSPASGKSHVRFIHLSPDAPAVDIVAKGVGTVFANSSFKDVADFTPVDAGTVTLEVQVAGSGQVVLTVPDVQLEQGKIYTIWASGLVADGSLGAEIIVNNP